MNIFYLAHELEKCARYHNDSHNVKMILEYCQLLSTAHRIIDGKLTMVPMFDKNGGQVFLKSGEKRLKKHYVLDDERENTLYRATHQNHPSAIWVRQSKQNYMWLHGLLVELCKEYTYRYGKTHKTQAIGLVDALSVSPNNIPDSEFTPPTPAMPDECKLEDSLSSYRNYYNNFKTHLASWKKRGAPEWFEPGVTYAHV